MSATSTSSQSLYESANKTLPPSPELKPSRHQQQSVDSEFSLEASPTNPLASNAPTTSQSRRLRSVARYQAFYPQALACSDTLTSSSLDHNLHDEQQPAGVSSTSLSSASPTKHIAARGASSSDATTSLGALAGPRGVALFRLSRPHIPLLILSHATNSTSKMSNLSGLAFQPNSGVAVSHSLYLAATRGSATLIWDASGHSNMPLIGRLGSDVNIADAIDTRITSMCWKPSSRLASATSPLLATTTAKSISLWDLRVAPQGSTSSFKPTLRFGTSKQTSFSNSSAVAPALVQVACSSESDEFATIDAAGIVRVYDIRMAERNRASSSSGPAVSSFRAHETAGVGLAYFPTTSATNNDKTSSSSWLTWGLDSPKASAVAKLWSWTSDDSQQQATTDPDDYWYMYATPFNRSDYRVKAQLVRPNLACARVCASPVENSFMAVGHLPYNNTADKSGPEPRGGWWAELCTLSSGDEKKTVDERLSSTTFGLNSVISFEGGGTSNYNWGQKALLSALGGRADLGRLQAAELAFVGVSNKTRSPPVVEGALDPAKVEEEKGSNVELVLCCLSDTSVITTHAVPEAMPKINNSRSGETGRSEQSMVRTAYHTSHQPRVYPEDHKEGASLVDAAGFWNSNALGAGEVSSSAADELGRTFADHKLSPQRNKLLHTVDNGLADPPTASSGRKKGEGGLLPFDLEVPVAYGSVSANTQVAVTDINSGAVVSTGGMGVVEEGEAVSGDARETTPILENIESERVPCPRLCGATFGFGNGGLVMFHNGEIKKMWNWFQRTDTIRLSSVPSGKAENSSSDPELLSPRVDVSNTENRTMASGPRTLKELVHMMKTAKEAQWGERDGSDGSGSDDDSSAGDNFFEEESLDSNSSDSGDEGALAHTSNHHLYNRYFGARAWKGTVEKGDDAGSHRRQNSDSATTSTRKIVPFVGPSYDMLAPVVSVTHDFDPAIVSHQSIELARGWELGGWEDATFSDIISMMRNEETPDAAIFDYQTSSLLTGKGLPHYRYLDPNPVKKGTMPRTKSDPNLDFKTMAQRSRTSIDDPSLHGGEHSIRPNMEDSMKFLKKLFSHQQDGSGAFPAMLSPPDNPLQWDRRSSSSAGHSPLLGNLSADQVDGTVPTGNPEQGEYRGTKLGVYTLRKESTNGENGKAVQVLSSIKDICLHNAEVCKSVGKTDKEGVWNLLAQTVDGQIGNKESGWGGKGGGALGVDLVSSLLRYYECLGDAQMLATMFCVLSGGFRSTSQPGSPKLLPQGQDEKYDAYIRKYAELLYAWGLLSVRAELNKHLLRVPSRREGNPVVEENKHLLRLSSRSGDDLSVEEKTDAWRSPGVAVIFHCPRCGQDADKNTNVCRNCQDFAFRCSICDNAVRGLFTVCNICNHGGHVDHMKSWFSEHIQCPTGCGCNCTFDPNMSTPADALQAMGQPMMAVDG